jgi:hypothetical protein
MPFTQFDGYPVHYLLLVQEKLSTFKTVKDYENWLNEEGFNGLILPA